MKFTKIEQMLEEGDTLTLSITKQNGKTVVITTLDSVEIEKIKPKNKAELIVEADSLLEDKKYAEAVDKLVTLQSFYPTDTKIAKKLISARQWLETINNEDVFVSRTNMGLTEKTNSLLNNMGEHFMKSANNILSHEGEAEEPNFEQGDLTFEIPTLK